MLNEARERAWQLSVPVPAGTKAGMPVALGSGKNKMCGVALTDRGAEPDKPENATVKFVGSFFLAVKGVEKEAKEHAIAFGDEIFIDAEGKLTADAGGTLWGYALEPVVKGKLETIEVKVATV